MRVRLAGQGWEFDAGADTTLLMAAQQAGVRLPSSCRNGTCRTCICKLESGAIRYLVEWPGVSLDEKREGWILPCVAVAQSDLELAVPAARRIEP
ncbi:2Fe-2S iron-sulfur cluster-binding protein [Pseudoduganella namucuonensis]|uniref:Ferredoxin n=1 Tax=Pseudoduganella namucuonensis TaxID=1035707 RepID=A0A1I7GH21_9BURK|nr:2Fe-2S iron-sulfur cluster binding domain-containing protein [Pseudoduganella namucuonensis]SFU47708.1 Ferredoxin [Pseudoduganella namucuonensis]